MLLASRSDRSRFFALYTHATRDSLMISSKSLYSHGMSALFTPTPTILVGGDLAVDDFLSHYDSSPVKHILRPTEASSWSTIDLWSSVAMR